MAIRWGGRTGPMFTVASIGPLAPLYFEIAGLNTSSNLDKRRRNCSCTELERHLSGSSETAAEYGKRLLARHCILGTGSEGGELLTGQS